MISEKRACAQVAKWSEKPVRTHLHTRISINESRTLSAMGRHRGRPPSSRRLRAEDCAALPVRLLPNLPPRRTPITKLDLDIVAGPPAYSPPINFTLRLARSTRGWRCLCPRCGRSAATIYFPLVLESHEPGCRICLQLVYGSQYEMSADAAWDRFVRAMEKDLNGAS